MEKEGTERREGRKGRSFGWNLIVGVTWWRVGRTLPWRIAAVAMPLAMGWAVVATANHWVVDVLAGGTVALTGLLIEQAWVRRRRRASADPSAAGSDTETEAAAASGGVVDPGATAAGARRRDHAPSDRSPPRNAAPGGSPVS